MRDYFVKSALALAGAILLLMPGRAAAQPRHPLSLDLAVGAGSSAGGAYQQRAGVSAEARIAWQPGRLPDNGWIFGANAGAQGRLGGNEACPPAPASCAEFPGFSYAGAMLGRQIGSGEQTALRLLAGPAYFSAHESTIGLQAQASVSSPTFWRMGVIGAARGAFLPDFRGDRIGLWSLGLGLRLR